MPRKPEPPPLLDWQLDEIREAFNLFDAEATGQISYYELRAAMRALNYNPRKTELRALIEDADPKKDGYVTFEKFLAIMSKHARTVDPQAECDAIFKLFAGDSKTISKAALREAAKEIGENMTDDDLDSLMEALSNESNSISIEKFRSVMLPKKMGDDLDEVDD